MMAMQFLVKLFLKLTSQHFVIGDLLPALSRGGRMDVGNMTHYDIVVLRWGIEGKVCPCKGL